MAHVVPRTPQREERGAQEVRPEIDQSRCLIFPGALERGEPLGAAAAPRGTDPRRAIVNAFCCNSADDTFGALGQRLSPDDTIQRNSRSLGVHDSP
jgi:hypothetical protein